MWAIPKAKESQSECKFRTSIDQVDATEADFFPLKLEFFLSTFSTCFIRRYPVKSAGENLTSKFSRCGGREVRGGERTYSDNNFDFLIVGSLSW